MTAGDTMSDHEAQDTWTGKSGICVYTVAVVFSVGDYTNPDQLWVAHFRRREDAVKAFLLKVRECGGSASDADFDELLEGGHYLCFDGSEENRVYVRHEEVHDSYDEENVSWS